MEKIDWSKFEIKAPIKADSDQIIKAWTSQQELEKWFLRQAEFTSMDGKKRKPNEEVQIGDSFRWSWFGWPDDQAEYGLPRFRDTTPRAGPDHG